jgi:hypothetical protein
VRRIVLLFAIVTALLGAITAVAAAAEVSRVEFRESAEPICKTDTQANERILSGVRKEVRSGKLAPASRKFGRAASALKSALRQLESLPRPSVDEARLQKWFGTVETEAGYFEAVSRQLKAGQKAAAESYVTRLTVTANKANNQVLPFEFTYCRLEPSRFT